MLRVIRETVKRMPIVGPALYNFYLKTTKNEGEVLSIEKGRLQGKRWIRFMRTHNDEYVRGDYEPEVQAAIERRLRPGMTFYDVGANAGFFSLLGSVIVGPAGTVIAFEPHPETAAQLLKQISENGASNVEVVEAAICDKVGIAEFSDDTFAVMASLVGSDSGTKTIKVKTTNLDQLIDDKKLPDVMKIDVEGAEIEALRGAEKMIRKKRPILLVELHSPEIAAEYDLLMKDFNYRTSTLEGEVIQAGQGDYRFVISDPL
jgi:FkbM family methyltransferase